MMWVPESEKNLKVCLFVMTEFTNVTDGQTDRWTKTAQAALMHSIAQQKPHLRLPGGDRHTKCETQCQRQTCVPVLLPFQPNPFSSFGEDASRTDEQKQPT